jgi:hypothetical protein
MNATTSFPHPAAHRSPLRRVATLVRRLDDPPGVDHNATPSDVAMRGVHVVHHLQR